MAILLLGVAIRTAWPKREARKSLTITAGAASGARAKIAELLAESTRHKGISLSVVSSAGSREALKEVNNGETDLALVQGGLVADGLPQVRRVASLHVEPLHLLVASEVFDEISQHIGALQGKTINLSLPGSGTHELAKEVLSFLRLEGEYNAAEFGYDQLASLEKKSLPDAIFVVSSLPSPIAEHLVRDKGYRLVSMPFARSFQLHWMEASGDSDVNRRRTSETRIPAYTYRVDAPEPPTPVETFGTRLELVANESLSQQTVDAICNTIYDSEFNQVYGERLDVDLLNRESTFQLHAGAEEYLRRQQPIQAGRVIELTEQLVGIGGAALGGLLFLWQWLRRLRERRRDREFVNCVQRVVQIENQALRFEQDDEMTVNDLEVMQDELGKIKTELIQQYRDGYLEGADMLSAFLKHANDASELISRIVLHETEPKAKNRV